MNSLERYWQERTRAQSKQTSSDSRQQTLKRETEAGKLDIGLILRDIRQTLVKITRNFGKKTLGLSPVKC